jgi:hypothetical protein
MNEKDGKLQMLNSQSKKIILRCCVLNKAKYYNHRDIFMVCNSMAEIGEKAWWIRRTKLAKDEYGYFTFREVLLA